MLLGINPLRLSTAKRNREPRGVWGGNGEGKWGRWREGRRTGVRALGAAELPPSARQPPCLHSALCHCLAPFPGTPPPQLLLPNLAGLSLDSSLWYIGSSSYLQASVPLPLLDSLPQPHIFAEPLFCPSVPPSFLTSSLWGARRGPGRRGDVGGSVPGSAASATAAGGSR